nr:hypothetical protein [Acanthopleuribacter pedis]
MDQPIELDYQAYYCEENVWRALHHPMLQAHPTFAVFISNPARMCPVWGMRAGESETHPVLWDYHVVLLEEHPSGPFIWDSDTRFGVPCGARDYLEKSFRFGLKPEFAPYFRVVDRDTMRAHFSTDRGHMKGPNGWQAPPPSWPLPGAPKAGNLARFIDMTEAWFGDVYTLEDFARRLLAKNPR